MGQDFFTNLPSEIIIDILSGLPFRTIIHCKCVCKSWLHLLETHEFVNTHYSISVPVLMVSQWLHNSNLYKIYEFACALNHELNDLHYNPNTKTNLPALELIPGYRSWINNSANGLLFLLDLRPKPYAFFICNPITREYIQLPRLQDLYYEYQLTTRGFGVSQMSGQHKVVKISNYLIHDETRKEAEIWKYTCHVYTLGTGSWRSIKPCVQFQLSDGNIGPMFLNGNLHWLLRVSHGPAQISLFDLETEVFSTFPTPSLPKHKRLCLGMSVLGDCLCLCDNSFKGKLVIWLLKKYGDEKSWTKEFVIKTGSDYLGQHHSFDHVLPVKLFENGDILMSMSWRNSFLVYYSNKYKSIWKIESSEPGTVRAISYTPSFISLKSFVMENVVSF